MKRWLKILLFSILGVVLLLSIGMGVFIYKVKYGFPIFESTAPELPAEMKDFSVLVFSKTNAFRHGEAIEASLPAFRQMGERNNWTVFTTDNGAVHNPEQLAKFDVVIWNNVTGKVLKPEQREHFKNYIESGGSFVGIHGAGDDSHQWDWYQKELIGAKFSHHSIDPHIQEGSMHRECPEGFSSCANHPATWQWSDEWYVFLESPRAKGAKVLYTVDESTITTSGNIKYLVSDKDFGMGDDHPMVWYNCVGQGKAFYSAMGHGGFAFEETQYIALLEDAIKWAGNKSIPCE